MSFMRNNNHNKRSDETMSTDEKKKNNGDKTTTTARRGLLFKEEPRWVNFAIVSTIVMTSFSFYYDYIQQTTYNKLLLTHHQSSDSLTSSPSSTAAAFGGGGGGGGKYQPQSCFQLLRELKQTKQNGSQSLVRRRYRTVEDPNNGLLQSRLTTTSNPFYISIHNKEFDGTRWVIMETGEYYEKKLTQAFDEILQTSPPGARVLDVGANIGYFSLLSASYGNRLIIDSFEPNIKNRIRFCESMNLNRWFFTEFDDRPNPIRNLQRNNASEAEAEADEKEEEAMMMTPAINLYPYGVGQEEGNFVFEEHANPGQGAVRSNQPTTVDNPKGVRIVTLDAFANERGWFDTNNNNNEPHIAILKIDVEGNEYQVLEGAQQLLQQRIVQNVFMEISVRSPQERKANAPCLKYFEQAGYRLHAVGGWAGPGTKVNWSSDNLPQRILQAADQENAKQLNLWWKLQGHDDDDTTIVGVTGKTNKTR